MEEDNSEQRLKIEFVEKINDDIKRKKFYSKIDAFFACLFSLATILATHGIYGNEQIKVIWTLLFSLEAAYYSILWSNTKKTIRAKNAVLTFVEQEIACEEKNNSK